MCVGLGQGGTVIWENPTTPTTAARWRHEHHRRPTADRDVAPTPGERSTARCPTRSSRTRSSATSTCRAAPASLALITLDNGLDHTRPNTFGPAGLRNLGAALDERRARAAAGEIAAVAVTGKPFIFAVGADLSDVGAGPRPRRRRWPSPSSATTGLPPARRARRPDVRVRQRRRAGRRPRARAALRLPHDLSSGAAAIALPECFLGLVPGWGGTYLLPNLIGVENAAQGRSSRTR